MQWSSIAFYKNCTTILHTVYKLQLFALLVQHECNLDNGMMLAGPWTLENSQNRHWAQRGNPALQKLYAKLYDREMGFRLSFWSKHWEILGAFPSGWEPAAWQQARDVNKPALNMTTSSCQFLFEVTGGNATTGSIVSHAAKPGIPALRTQGKLLH